MREINEAYEILSDAKKRKQHDDARPDTQSAGSTFYEEKTRREHILIRRPRSRWELETHHRLLPRSWEAPEKSRAPLSQDLAFTYKAYMVTERKFESEQNIHRELEANFLKKYFGIHPEIQNYGKNLLLKKHKSLAQALNKDVEAFFGNDIRPNEFLRKFFEKSGLEREPSQNAVLQITIKEWNRNSL